MTDIEGPRGETTGLADLREKILDGRADAFIAPIESTDAIRESALDSGFRVTILGEGITLSILRRPGSPTGRQTIEKVVVKKGEVGVYIEKPQS